MSDQIIIYSKPVNKYNLEGRFYNVYLNKNTNLDLSSLQNSTPIVEKIKKVQGTFNNIKDAVIKKQMLEPNSTIAFTSQNEILIPREDWMKLLQLYSSQSQILEEYRKLFKKFQESYKEHERKITGILAEQQPFIQRIQSQTNQSKRSER